MPSKLGREKVFSMKHEEEHGEEWAEVEEDIEVEEGAEVEIGAKVE